MIIQENLLQSVINRKGKSHTHGAGDRRGRDVGRFFKWARCTVLLQMHLICQEIVFLAGYRYCFLYTGRWSLLAVTRNRWVVTNLEINKGLESATTLFQQKP